MEGRMELENNIPDHPLLSLFKNNEERIQKLGQQFHQLSEKNDKVNFFKQEYAFLAEELCEIHIKSLNTTDLIEIWPAVLQFLPSIYQRYPFAGMLVNRFATQDLDQSQWGDFALRSLESSVKVALQKIPVEQHDWEHLARKMDEIRNAIAPIIIERDSLEKGDRFTLLNEIMENFINGWAELDGAIDDRLEA